MSDNDLLIKNPVLLVGIGGAGSKIATATSAAIGSRCLLISNDKKDLAENNSNDNCSSVFIDSGGWVNPSSYKLRSFVQSRCDEIASATRGFPTIIIVSNLAGRAGTAMGPIVCKAAKEASTVISVAIMPFKFEKDRIFHSGTALRRVREASHSTIVLDNDAFLDNNPELSKEECFKLTNSAIVEVIGSISSAAGVRSDMNVLCTSRESSDSESSLRDSVAMLYDGVADANSIRASELRAGDIQGRWDDRSRDVLDGSL